MASVAIVACLPRREAVVPIPTIEHERLAPREAGGLMIMLPGIFDSPESFSEESMVSALFAINPRFNAVCVDAHFGYYQGKHNSIVERLRDDVIVPARRRGYRSIWLLGVSLGAFGSILYASQYPEHVDGVIALAPFLGPDEVTDEIADAGGLRRWRPDLQRGSSEERFFKRVWGWLRGYATHDTRPPLFLGYGARDKFAEFDGMLAEVLEPQRVKVMADGEHDWATWKALFTILGRRAL